MAKALDQGDLIELLTRSAKDDLLSALGPVVGKLSEAIAELQSILGEGSASKRRGRKPAAARPGRKPAVVEAAPKGKRGRRRAGNAPRGALKKAVMEILQKANKPLALSDIVEAVMKTEDFRGRNAKSIYNKVNADLSKAAEVQRVEKGVYALK